MIFLWLSTANCQLSTHLTTLSAPRIPPVAWIAIFFIILFTLAVNIAMVALLRAKASPDKAKRQPKGNGMVNASRRLARMGEVMRDPFARERGQLDELSRLVHRLEEQSSPADRDKPNNQE